MRNFGGRVVRVRMHVRRLAVDVGSSQTPEGHQTERNPPECTGVLAFNNSLRLAVMRGSKIFYACADIWSQATP